MRKRPDDDGVIIHEYLWYDEFIEGEENEELEDLIDELEHSNEEDKYHE